MKRKIDQAAVKEGVTKSQFVRAVIKAMLERMEERGKYKTKSK